MYSIFTYIYHQNQQNVGKYTSPMDGMGNAPNPVRIKHVNLWACKLLHYDGSYIMANYYFPNPPECP